MDFSRIKNFREDNDYPQKKVAKYLNIAVRTYSGYESGTRNYPVQIIVELAHFYNTSTDYLLGLTDEKKPYKRANSK